MTKDIEIHSGCSVALKQVGLHQARVIGELRKLRSDLSIPQVKSLLQHLPFYLAEDVSESRADNLAQSFQSAGAEVDVTKPNVSTRMSDWLQQRCSLDEIKIQNPGGFVDGPVWRALEGKMQPGDEIWTFSSPEYFWRNLCGRGGYAVVRDRKVVYTVLTVMN